MRLGLRLQLLLAIGALLVLTFIPLFVAVANVSRATMLGVREGSAKALGRAVAGHVLEARHARSEADLQGLLEAQLGPGGVSALGLYVDGRALVLAGEPDVRQSLPPTLAPDHEELREVTTPLGAGLLIVVPDRNVSETKYTAAVLLRTDASTLPIGPLLSLVGLYTGLVGLGLLVFAYIAMTRLVVRPVADLSHAARRVAEGARKLDNPVRGARELVELGASIAQMTEALLADERALREKILALEKATKELEAAQNSLVRSERLASVGRLAAGLAHEIGNPLSAILGFEELLLMGGLEPEEERDFLTRMKRETERISKILRDLLDFARPAVDGKAREARGRGVVLDAANDVLALVRPQRALQNATLTLDMPKDLPAVVLSQERLVQVLLNLVLNAADVVPAMGGDIRIHAAVEGPTLHIEVVDNGPGIAPQVKERLFEPFVTTKDVGKGTGLGLAVCRGLVEAVGGSISGENRPEGGARFCVVLPVADKIV